MKWKYILQNIQNKRSDTFKNIIFGQGCFVYHWVVANKTKRIYLELNQKQECSNVFLSIGWIGDIQTFIEHEDQLDQRAESDDPNAGKAAPELIQERSGIS